MDFKTMKHGVLFGFIGGELQHRGRLLEELRAPEAAVQNRH